MILKVFDVLVEAGAELGLRHAGFQALNTLSLDKAYRDIGFETEEQLCCPLISSGGTRVAGTVDLLNGQDGDRMSIGSAKHSGRRHRRVSLEHASQAPVRQALSLRQ
jgi:glycine cleavage system aminomethyltransferase T